MRWAATSWTQVLAARDAPSWSRAWHSRRSASPIRSMPSFVGRGLTRRKSRDLTQAYFARLIEKGYLEDFDPSVGRFRVFLKASVKHFLSKERERDW